MGERGRPYKRRQWLVNRQFQLRFVKAVLLVICAMAIAALGIVYVAMRITLITYELLNDQLIASLFNTIFWLTVLELLIIVPLVVWMGIRLTHKVAGPLVRIHAALAQMSKGQFDIHISLRKGDMLLELADDVNRLAASLRSKGNPGRQMDA